MMQKYARAKENRILQHSGSDKLFIEFRQEYFLADDWVNEDMY